MIDQPAVIESFELGKSGLVYGLGSCGVIRYAPQIILRDLSQINQNIADYDEIQSHQWNQTCLDVIGSVNTGTEMTKLWYQHGQLHRDQDQPAILSIMGYRAWYQKDHLDRGGDQPAIIHSDGTREWWRKGLLSRDHDQPTIIRADGTQEWWSGTEKYKDVILCRDHDQPAIIRLNGTLEWWDGKARHRDHDQPAIVSSQRQEWWFHGQRHREGNQPAVLCLDGTREWWIQGQRQPDPVEIDQRKRVLSDEVELSLQPPQKRSCH